jgi:hypothetical protein
MKRHQPMILATAILGWTALLAAAPAPGAGLESAGWLSVEAGHLAHPLGVAEEPASPYGHGALVQEFALVSDRARLELSYRGDLTAFDPEVDLGYTRHALGVEYLRPASRPSQLAVSAGAQGALRRQAPTYAIYDHDEAVGYLAAKVYAHPRLMLRGVAGLRWRRYESLPEESYLEPHATLELKHFSPSRRTLGATVRLGGKWYHEPAAVRVWESRSTPTTSQLAASLLLAQGVSDRVGVRASAGYRATLDGFPYYVDEEIYDNPLLDRYARQGWNADGEVKWLMPSAVWLRLGLDWRTDDYGEIRFRTADADGHRLDRVLAAWLSLERRLGFVGRDLTLRLNLGFTDQRSTLATYTWSGPTAGAGLQWRW